MESPWRFVLPFQRTSQANIVVQQAPKEGIYIKFNKKGEQDMGFHAADILR